LLTDVVLGLFKTLDYTASKDRAIAE